ncbi:hypothetical protein [Leifsonia sp. ZF2019]|uniref:hypothetical protein n=1 Tax=Leifsonia sp. ZF2019 TaxID=2781978 RepID=UPI001CC08F2D|nr:hypothetical protein [Leifsonia sp. ZF2019]
MSPDAEGAAEGTGSPEILDSSEALDSAESLGPWTAALERMEGELHSALAGADPVPWRPPIALGPLPAALHDRAARLLEAQHHTIRHLEDVRQTTAKHLAAVKSVPRAEDGPRPVYFDLLG